MENIDWSSLKAVIFDVDGTLYNQRALCRRIFFNLMAYYFVNPLRSRELKILHTFRWEREKNEFDPSFDIEAAQYIKIAKICNVSLAEVHEVVEKWIFRIPLKYILYYRYPGLLEYFNSLRSKGMLIAIFSDYPASEKLSALNLDVSHIFSATDKNINRLKPDPKGLLVITQTLGVSVEESLFIGDRDDRDGECARRAGMRYLIMEQKCSGKNNRFQIYQQLNRYISY